MSCYQYWRHLVTMSWKPRSRVPFPSFSIYVCARSNKGVYASARSVYKYGEKVALTLWHLFPVKQTFAENSRQAKQLTNCSIVSNRKYTFFGIIGEVHAQLSQPNTHVKQQVIVWNTGITRLCVVMHSDMRSNRKVWLWVSLVFPSW